MDDTAYQQLPKVPRSSKTVYMGHRRWLHPDDEWRSRGDMFNGTDDTRGPPRKRKGPEIDKLLKDWKECPAPGKKRKAPDPLMRVWKTRYVFWDLDYWPIYDRPHSLDVMHITKNVCESFLGTLLNMPEKTKDGPKARNDPRILKIRKELQGGPPDKSPEETDEGRKGKKVKNDDDDKKGKKVKKEYYCPPPASL